MELCESLVRGEIKGCFIEMNMCYGGCIQGPTVTNSPVSRFKVKLDMEDAIQREPVPCEETGPVLEEISLRKVFSDHSPKEPVPTNEEIQQILAMTGKLYPCLLYTSRCV